MLARLLMITHLRCMHGTEDNEVTAEDEESSSQVSHAGPDSRHSEERGSLSAEHSPKKRDEWEYLKKYPRK